MVTIRCDQLIDPSSICGRKFTKLGRGVDTQTVLREAVAHGWRFDGARADCGEPHETARPARRHLATAADQ